MTDPTDQVTLPMPTLAAGPLMGMIQVDLIAESLTNPRKTFDPAKLAELAESIRATGVHQPVLLRPLPGSRLTDTAHMRPRPVYELVCGARRLRACVLAGVAEIPAMVRELTDQQALEAAVIENLQREDIPELEEAEGYEYLMQQSRMTAEEVGAKIGKGRTYIYNRLKLLDLCQEGRQKMREGVLDYSCALLVARIPDDKQQIKAMGEILKPSWTDEPMSYRQAADHVQRHYMLRLDRAVWTLTDATLLPTAGACNTCHKRTGHAPDLFADVNGADLCIDQACYHAKEEAYSAAIKAQALARGQHIIEGREAKALMPSPYVSRVEGYLRLDDRADSPNNQPLRKLIGKAMEQAGIQPTLIANPHSDGELIAVLTADQVSTLLRATAYAKEAEELEAAGQRAADTSARVEEEKIKHSFEEQWRWGTLRAAWKAIASEGPSVYCLPDEAIRQLALQKAYALNKDKAKRLALLLDLGKVAPCDAVQTWVKDHAEPEKCLALLTMHEDVEYRSWLPEGRDHNPHLLLLAGDVKVDIAAVKQQVMADLSGKTAKKTPSADPLAARAGDGTEGGSKAAKAGKAANTRPAARAKVSAQEAQQGIAAAMQSLEGPCGADTDQGADAQGIEAGSGFALPAPVDASPNTSAPIGTDAGQDQDGAPDDTPQSSTTPPATAAPSTTWRPKDGKKLQVRLPDQPAEPVGIGARVKVLANARAPKQAKFVGKVGTVKSQIGPAAWDVLFTAKGKGVASYVAFHTTELETV